MSGRRARANASVKGVQVLTVISNNMQCLAVADARLFPKHLCCPSTLTPAAGCTWRCSNRPGHCTSITAFCLLSRRRPPPCCCWRTEAAGRRADVAAAEAAAAVAAAALPLAQAALPAHPLRPCWACCLPSFCYTSLGLPRIRCQPGRHSTWPAGAHAPTTSTTCL